MNTCKKYIHSYMDKDTSGNSQIEFFQKIGLQKSSGITQEVEEINLGLGI